MAVFDGAGTAVVAGAAAGVEEVAAVEGARLGGSAPEDEPPPLVRPAIMSIPTSRTPTAPTTSQMIQDVPPVCTGARSDALHFQQRSLPSMFSEAHSGHFTVARSLQWSGS